MVPKKSYEDAFEHPVEHPKDVPDQDPFKEYIKESEPAKRRKRLCMADGYRPAGR